MSAEPAVAGVGEALDPVAEAGRATGAGATDAAASSAAILGVSPSILVARGLALLGLAGLGLIARARVTASTAHRAGRHARPGS